jgi:hypothetical protein
MAAAEPKITKLKPGEGAGDFQPKQGGSGGKGARRGTPQGQKRTQNPCILSDGSVDPQCKKVYQRSVAGREKLEDYVKRLDSQGASEKDVFMAAVNSLMNRGHGYVGAYLDSKSPGRTYNQNQAMKIADSVMSKADVGENPGARLTPESGGAKETRAEKRSSGATPEPGKKAMSVGQQRKQPEGRGGGAGMPETWAKPGEKNAARPIEKPKQKQTKEKPAPKTDLQRTLDEYKAGKLSKEELADRLKKKIDGESSLPPSAPPLPGSAAAASRDSAIERKKEAPPQQESTPVPVSEEKVEEDAAPATKELPPDEQEDDDSLKVSDEQITTLFRSKYNEERKNALARAQAAARKNREIAPSSVELTPDDLEFLAQDTIDELSEQFKVEPEKAIAAINKKFGLKIAAPEAEQQQAPSEPESITPEQQATSPEREKLPEELLGKGRARKSKTGGGGGFIPEAGSKVKDAIEQAVAEGKTAQQVVKEYKQGNLFPGGLVTDTAQTNPLEGGSTPESTPEQPASETETPGQKTFLKAGTETSKKPQIKPSSIQVPSPAQDVADAKSYTKQLVDAGIPTDKIVKAVKEAFPTRSARRAPKRKTSNSSEYQQFSDAVREVVRIRSAQHAIT